MIIKFKKLHPKAKAPTRANEWDAGWDLTAVDRGWNGTVMTYHTGLAIEVPQGYVGLLAPRSSICNTRLMLKNSIGILDAGYRGEVLFKFSLDAYAQEIDDYRLDDRIGQLIIMPIPAVTFEEVDELGTSERGEGGFGSSGR